MRILTRRAPHWIQMRELHVLRAGALRTPTAHTLFLVHVNDGRKNILFKSLVGHSRYGYGTNFSNTAIVILNCTNK